jgi:hypothetical protein
MNPAFRDRGSWSDTIERYCRFPEFQIGPPEDGLRDKVETAVATARPQKSNR